MNTLKSSNDKVELRSEKVRKLIEEIPTPLLRWGTTIIALIFLVLLIALSLLPYPYSKEESILQHFIR